MSGDRSCRLAVVVTLSLEITGRPDHDQFFEPLIAMSDRLRQHEIAQATLGFGSRTNDGDLAGLENEVVASSRMVSSC